MSNHRKRIAIISIVSLIVILSGIGNVSGDLIVNGDFEDNTAGRNVFNPSNADFNALMANVTAYGIREGIDIMTAGSGFGADPQSGDWKVTPAADGGGNSEEFSFDLTGQVSTGGLYQLEFYIERLFQNPFDGGNVEIGLSNSSTSFGTLVYTSSQATDGWSLESTTFIAPVNANFMSVRVDTTADHWVGLDNFSLTQIPEPISVTILAPIAGVLVLSRRRRIRG